LEKALPIYGKNKTDYSLDKYSWHKSYVLSNRCNNIVNLIQGTKKEPYKKGSGLDFYTKKHKEI